MKAEGTSDEQDHTVDMLYDRSFKKRCFEEVLEHYGSFMNIANYTEDIKLIFLLTMCRMIDKAKTLPDNDSHKARDHEGNYDADKDEDNYIDSDNYGGNNTPFYASNARETDDGNTSGDFSLVFKTAPWNLKALLANQQRFFSRYKFDGRSDEATNAKEFIDRLLDQPRDSTTRFV